MKCAATCDSFVSTQTLTSVLLGHENRSFRDFEAASLVLRPRCRFGYGIIARLRCSDARRASSRSEPSGDENRVYSPGSRNR